MLRTRGLSAIVIVAPLLIAIALGTWALTILLAVVAAIAAGEAFRLLKAAGFPSLALFGTVLAVAFVLEEGLPVEELRSIVADMAAAAATAGVAIVAGDTKVVQRGAADGCYITTTGVGVLPPGRRLGPERVQAGELPAGRWATFVHVGPYRSETEPDLAAGRATLEAWADAQGLTRGDYVEHYVKGPVKEPDHARWETELASLTTA